MKKKLRRKFKIKWNKIFKDRIIWEKNYWDHISKKLKQGIFVSMDEPEWFQEKHQLPF